MINDTSAATIASLSAEALNLLHCCWGAAVDAAGGDFGFSTEAFAEWRATRPEGTQHRFAGLYGALVNAGVIYSDDEVEINGRRLKESQYDFSDEAREYLEATLGY